MKSSLSILFLAFSVLTACTPAQQDFSVSAAHKEILDCVVRPPYPPLTLAVISDTHVYDTALGVSGEAYQKALAGDRKLFGQSKEIFETALEKIRLSEASIVLVTGDLTKDGEKVNHLIVRDGLEKLQKAGKAVFVIPGNHDVANGWAVRYEAEKRIPVDNVSEEDFASIYADMGYAGALARDKASLSYTASMAPGLRLLALDSTRHRENKSGQEPLTGGAFSDETLKWIKDQLAQAATDKQAVIAMMHHGILEHFQGQKKIMKDYVVEGSPQIAQMFSQYGVQVVFTGHFHAQDITQATWEGKTLYDIETGSLASYPCPYRLVKMQGQSLVVHSKLIESIPSIPSGFQDFAEKDTRDGVSRLVAQTLQGYGISAGESQILANRVGEAFIAHYRGDEPEWKGEPLDTSGVSFWASFIIGFKKDFVSGLRQDLPPADNDVTLVLAR